MVKCIGDFTTSSVGRPLNTIALRDGFIMDTGTVISSTLIFGHKFHKGGSFSPFLQYSCC